MTTTVILSHPYKGKLPEASLTLDDTTAANLIRNGIARASSSSSSKPKPPAKSSKPKPPAKSASAGKPAAPNDSGSTDAPVT